MAKFKPELDFRFFEVLDNLLAHVKASVLQPWSKKPIRAKGLRVLVDTFGVHESEDVIEAREFIASYKKLVKSRKLKPDKDLLEAVEQAKKIIAKGAK